MPRSWAAWRCPGALLRLAITAFDVSTGTAACLPVPRRGRWAALLLGRIPLALTHQTIRDGHGIHPVPGLLGRCWPR